MTSEVFRKLIQDQERLRKLTTSLGDLDKLANPMGTCRKLFRPFVCWLILRHGSQTSKQQRVLDVG